MFASPDSIPDLTLLAEMVRAATEKAAAGDLSEVKAMLVAQAMACNAVFADQMRRAAMNANSNPEASETYLRTGFKAQAQSRATTETLAEIVNPRPIFINPRQVNHANGPQQINNAGGPQQVNNGDAQPVSLPDRSDEQG
jgi:hypothetical protein